MSTIKSSDEHLTLNADGSSKDIKFQANGVEKASISSSGAFTSTTIDATKLTGALPAISGAALTGLTTSQMPTGTIIYAATTDFGSGQYQSATTNTTVYSTTTITIPSVPAGGKILAIFNGGFGESSSGYGNYWGFHINGTAYASLIRATQSHLDSNTMQKTVTLSSAATNVVVKIVSTHSGASYQEFRLGGASPATLSVFVIK